MGKEIENGEFVQNYLNENLLNIVEFQIDKSAVVIKMKNGDVVHIDTYTNNIDKDVVLMKNE